MPSTIAAADSGALLTRQVTSPGGNELISQAREGDSRFYLYDSHSGTRQLTDEAGAVTDSYLYDAYGNVLKQMGDTENSYLYRGEQTDSETGLQYLRARYNDFETGRLIRVDPFEGTADTPMSVHRYLYGYNKPVQYSDPSGMVATVADSKGALGLQGILNSINWAKWAPGINRGIGIGLVAYNNFRGDLREWSGKAYGGKTPSIPLSQYDIFPIDPSFEGLTIRASTETTDKTGTFSNTYTYIIGNFNFGFLDALLGTDITMSAPGPSAVGDSFRAYTKRSYGANPVLLTPFTLGVKAGSKLFPGTQFNASTKLFLMGVGFAGITSSNANIPSISAKVSAGISLWIPDGLLPQRVTPTPKS